MSRIFDNNTTYKQQLNNYHAHALDYILTLFACLLNLEPNKYEISLTYQWEPIGPRLIKDIPRC